ncbi:phosphoadenosine phosphosulfate reductase family protein [Desulfovibrio ferrophilus]|uniref:Phosphoadenosine phosphosulfate reductase n=1 Tax=Desulfovibrio ferrophilus TaxID=241368 RepID=A0A2Z6AVJ2_9BACT|nr:phosphoadenosine phosphosulfate reductase family protein [Desulfovibrio ferrophilus]BBD07269.1 phosphoadenosine phosphosulfate reductase [Desulfovibrio ferrophilus]
MENHKRIISELYSPDPGGPTLDGKIAEVVACVDSAIAAVGPDGLAVAWTGGKDSTLVLHLVRERLAELAPGASLRAISIDTGCKFPQVVAFRDALAREWDVQLTIARPEVDMAGYPVAHDKAACCHDLKVLPLNRAIKETGIQLLLTGIRADEHPSRAMRPAVEAVAEPAHLRLHPLLHFSEMDVWSFIMDRGLPVCPLYQQGYRSLGCMPCTVLPGTGQGERSGRDQDKESMMDTLHSLGYF